MTNALKDPLESARALLTAARELYAADERGLSELRELYPQDEDVLAELRDLEDRLDQPLRVALVGSVKAGKSTLLNGLLGERIAPTDSRECTRIVTWYHHGVTPRVRAHLVNGETVPLPAKRQRDRLELDLESLSPADVERLDVDWPAPDIRGITLIDTPGIASISHQVSNHTHRFLLPEQGAGGADAVVYLLRSLHETDLRFLQALHERTHHGKSAIGSIAVLSRADELGGGRLTAMMSINQTVEDLRNDPALDGVCETIVPVAGLMGMGATTLRQADFTLLKALAERAPDDTGRVLISGERFITAKDDWLPEERARIDLIDRFGMYGIKLALAALRGGIDDAADLSAELLRRSGLEELRRVIDVHFTQRQSELKAHSIVLATHRILKRRPVPGAEQLLIAADAHMAAAHTFAEMQLIGRIASGRLSLAPPLLEELERVIGGRGASIPARLNAVGEEIRDAELLTRAADHLSRWRALLENPLLDRETSRACKVAERSCESMVAALMKDERSAPRVRENAR